MTLAVDPSPPAPGADLSNWRNAPFSRWAFRNIRDLIPVAEIAAAPEKAMQLPSQPADLSGFMLSAHDGAPVDFKDFLLRTATDGIVILYGGKIVFEFYDHGNAQHAPHILMSATKSVVGLLVGILCRNGTLDIGAAVSNYVPEIAATAYGGATIRNLIDMRAGVVLEGAQLAAYSAATGWDALQPSGAPPDLHAFFENMDVPHKDHGGAFRYISANTDLLGWAIARAAGKSFATLASELLWQPMGAEDGAFITTDSKGAPRCTGGFSATVRDLARIGQLVLDNGMRGEKDIVPADWIEDIASNGDRDAWTNGEWGKAFAPISPNMSYRSGWYVIGDEPKTMFAMGIHGQNLFVDRANKLVIAKVSSQNLPIDYAALVLTHRAVPEIRRCLLESRG